MSLLAMAHDLGVNNGNINNKHVRIFPKKKLARASQDAVYDIVKGKYTFVLQQIPLILL